MMRTGRAGKADWATLALAAASSELPSTALNSERTIIPRFMAYSS
jgi:hypothetical protein